MLLLTRHCWVWSVAVTQISSDSLSENRAPQKCPDASSFSSSKSIFWSIPPIKSPMWMDKLKWNQHLAWHSLNLFDCSSGTACIWTLQPPLLSHSVHNVKEYHHKKMIWSILQYISMSISIDAHCRDLTAIRTWVRRTFKIFMSRITLPSFLWLYWNCYFGLSV